MYDAVRPRPDPPAQVQAVHPWHHPVGDHEPDIVLLDALPGVDAVDGRDDLVAHLFERLAEDERRQQVVLDDQDFHSALVVPVWLSIHRGPASRGRTRCRSNHRTRVVDCPDSTDRSGIPSRSPGPGDDAVGMAGGRGALATDRGPATAPTLGRRAARGRGSGVRGSIARRNQGVGGGKTKSGNWKPFRATKLAPDGHLVVDGEVARREEDLARDGGIARDHAIDEEDLGRGAAPARAGDRVLGMPLLTANTLPLVRMRLPWMYPARPGRTCDELVPSSVWLSERKFDPVAVPLAGWGVSPRYRPTRSEAPLLRFDVLADVDQVQVAADDDPGPAVEVDPVEHVERVQVAAGRDRGPGQQGVEGDPVDRLVARDDQRAGQVGRVVALDRADHGRC